MQFFNAFFPIAALIGIGYFCKKYDWMPEGFWANSEKLAYFLLMPALLIHKLAAVNPGELPMLNIAIVVSMTLLAGVIAMFIQQKIIPFDGPAQTSLVQGSTRFNTFIALALANTLFGPEALVILVFAIGVKITIVNVICATAFAVLLKKPGSLLKQIIREIIRNPLIIGCCIGLFFQYTQLPMPTAINNTLEILGEASLTLGILAVGAAFARNQAGLPSVKSFLSSSVIKFGILPVAAYSLSVFVGFDAETIGYFTFLFLMPTAPSSYVLARTLGGDADLMARLIVWQTVFAAVLLPLAYKLGII